MAIPIQPSEPSCQASSVQVSIISANDGSVPPAAVGFAHTMSPLFHNASTIRPVSVRSRSDSPASAALTSRSVRAASGPVRARVGALT